MIASALTPVRTGSGPPPQFASFVPVVIVPVLAVPGPILGMMVSGCVTIAGILAWTKHRYRGSARLVAGNTLLGWHLIEPSVIHDGHVLRAALLVRAIAIIMLACRR